MGWAFSHIGVVFNGRTKVLKFQVRTDQSLVKSYDWSGLNKNHTSRALVGTLCPRWHNQGPTLTHGCLANWCSLRPKALVWKNFNIEPGALCLQGHGQGKAWKRMATFFQCAVFVQLSLVSWPLRFTYALWFCFQNSCLISVSLHAQICLQHQICSFFFYEIGLQIFTTTPNARIETLHFKLIILPPW